MLSLRKLGFHGISPTLHGTHGGRKGCSDEILTSIFLGVTNSPRFKDFVINCIYRQLNLLLQIYIINCSVISRTAIVDYSCWYFQDGSLMMFSSHLLDFQQVDKCALYT